MLRRAYGNGAMCLATCFAWYVLFKRGRTLLEGDKWSGRPSKSSTPKNVETIRWFVHVDRRRTIKGIAAIVNVSYRTVHTILTSDLNIHRVAETFVPRLLTPEQKVHRVAICLEIRQRAVDDQSFMSSIITGEENWVYGYKPETKQQSSQWMNPGFSRSKKARQSRRSNKNMLIGIFDTRRVVQHEFVPQGQAVNAQFYCSALRRLREDIRRKRPELWRADKWCSMMTTHPLNEISEHVRFSRSTLPHFRIRLTCQIWPLVTSSCSRR
jgi:hypothetical protein